MARITTVPGGASFTCAPDDTILRAGLRAGLGMPYSCNTGSCGNCRFELLEGSVSHVRDAPPAWSARDKKRNRWLACQARADGDCVIKVRQDSANISRYRPRVRASRLVSVTPVAGGISEFSFEIDGADGFQPGQYAMVNVPGVLGARPYSMSNLPGHGLWNFMIKRAPEGTATAHLFDVARAGDTFTLDGPYGTAWLRAETSRDIILMAGGSGLSPMASIARGAVLAGLHEVRKVHFYYGCRDGGDLILPGVLGDLPDQIRVTSVLSEPSKGSGWTGATGFLHDAVARGFGDRLGDHDIYFAGPAVMSAAVQLMSLDAGVPSAQLHFDEFF